MDVGASVFLPKYSAAMDNISIITARSVEYDIPVIIPYRIIIAIENVPDISLPILNFLKKPYKVMPIIAT